jgi:hypothetical protein
VLVQIEVELCLGVFLFSFFLLEEEVVSSTDFPEGGPEAVCIVDVL